MIKKTSVKVTKTKKFKMDDSWVFASGAVKTKKSKAKGKN